MLARHVGSASHAATSLVQSLRMHVSHAGAENAMGVLGGEADAASAPLPAAADAPFSLVLTR